jgi:hypothetical protein
MDRAVPCRLAMTCAWLLCAGGRRAIRRATVQRAGPRRRHDRPRGPGNESRALVRRERVVRAGCGTTWRGTGRAAPNELARIAVRTQYLLSDGADSEQGRTRAL